MLREKESHQHQKPRMVRHESLAMKELCSELSKVMNKVIKTVNCIKTYPLKRRFCRIMPGNGGTASDNTVSL
jgi:hypothetical protein